jgi:NAD/NADP transhydrogenase beta subunit
MPLIFWIIWLLAIAATASYTWWAASSAGVPLDMTLLVLRSAIVGLLGLIVITRAEARMAPWRFFK